jgi:hypothetical protein
MGFGERRGTLADAWVAADAHVRSQGGRGGPGVAGGVVSRVDAGRSAADGLGLAMLQDTAKLIMPRNHPLNRSARPLVSICALAKARPLTASPQ